MDLRNANLVNLKVLRVLARVVVGALGLLMFSPLAHAQAPSPFAVETNIHGVYAYTQPPAGFNPLTASAAELELYGYPPRPAATESAKAFARWAMIVNPALKRVVPQLLQTNIYHRPASNVLIQNSKKSTSTNWSGYALLHKKPAFSSVAGAWIVPSVQQAFGTCSGGTDYSSQWVGIDGFENTYLLQAGSDADASCTGGTTTTTYYPWIEWLPEVEIELTQQNGNPLPFAPGDYLTVVVTATNWSGGESTNGALLYTDVTQNWQISASFTAADLGGSFVVGQSAEWIVESPEVGEAIANLANYVADPWFDASVTDIKNKTYLPGSPKGATSYAITMLNGGGSPISFVDLFGTDTLWFFDEGSAL